MYLPVEFYNEGIINYVGALWVGTIILFYSLCQLLRTVFTATFPRRKVFNLSQGFTLVELLVVIAIIGVLATLVLVQLGTARGKSRDAKRISDIAQLRSALELFYDDNGARYPIANTAAPNNVNSHGVPGGILFTDISKYLSVNTAPMDPIRAAPYNYASAGSATAPTAYHLWVQLEQKNTSALAADADANSTLASAPWNVGPLGDVENLSAVELCTAAYAVTAVDCAYDVASQ